MKERGRDVLRGEYEVAELVIKAIRNKAKCIKGGASNGRGRSSD